MKKLLLGFVLLVGIVSTASATHKYSCTRYVNGSNEGHTFVRADSVEEAEKKAYDKYKYDLNKKVDRVSCRMSFL